MLHSVSVPQAIEPAISDIIAVVSSATGFSNSRLVGRNRSAALALARQVAMKLARQLTSLSLVEIGEQFGGRDHGTVIHACKVISDRMRTSRRVADLVESCTRRIRRQHIPLSALPPMPVSRP